MRKIAKFELTDTAILIDGKRLTRVTELQIRLSPEKEEVTITCEPDSIVALMDANIKLRRPPWTTYAAEKLRALALRVHLWLTRPGS